MQEEVTKRFKGKTLKFFGHQEGDFWTGHIYCPWCSVKKFVGRKSSLKRAAKLAFDIIEGHWNVDHKNK